MRILTLNYGSTNLKWAVFEGHTRVDSGQRDAASDSELQAAIEDVLSRQAEVLTRRKVSAFRNEPGGAGKSSGDTGTTGNSSHATSASGADASLRPLEAVVHRVVHGGALNQPTRIDRAVLEEIEQAVAFSPIHNRRAVIGIQAAQRFAVPQVAVFDTAFHAGLPQVAHTYALPRGLRERGIRRFGFHGLAFASALRQTAETLEIARQHLNAILIHLGGGCSICAVQGGRCVDTSMGLTPLEGLVMGSRSGDVDPGIILWLLNNGYSASQVEELLVRRSGLIGLAGTDDMRAIEHRATTGDREADFALDVYCYRIRKYVGAYWAILRQLDAIVFSGGVGANSALVRARVLSPLAPLGIRFDAEANRQHRPVLSPRGHRPAALVVKADEEREMVRQAIPLLTELREQ